MKVLRSGLYAVTPDWADNERLLRVLAQALKGGASVVQYRNKLANQAQKRAQIKAILPLCQQHQVPLIVNDDLDLALELGADGVHLGKEDAPEGGLAAARAALGPDRILGVSCYDQFSRAQEADRHGANYVAFGTLFPSSTKPLAVRAHIALLGRARHELSCLVAGIGGITLENSPLAQQAGADLLAVISDLFEADDVEARARAYATIYKQERT